MPHLPGELSAATRRRLHCRHHANGRTLNNTTHTAIPQSGHVSSIRSAASVPNRRPMARTQHPTQSKVPTRQSAQWRVPRIFRLSTPLPTSHHAGRQNTGRLKALQASSVMPAGTRLCGQALVIENKASPSVPGIFRAVNDMTKPHGCRCDCKHHKAFARNCHAEVARVQVCVTSAACHLLKAEVEQSRRRS